ncbi:MAG: CotH kinase family protein [Flavobacteriales bacterium]
MKSIRLSLAWIMALTSILAQSQIFINEFIASNSMLLDDPDFENSSDWVELYNAGSTPVDLTGWFFTDNLSDTTKWVIPSGYSIGAGEFLMIWCDGEDVGLNQLHSAFKLSSIGEEIGLYSPELVLEDALVFGPQATDVSYGRSLDGAADWSWFSNPTPGASNNSSTAYTGVSQGIPYFSMEGGFYVEPFSLELTALSGVIHYTTDGREPTASDAIVEGPIMVDSTTFIRARVFEENHIPGPTITHTYFFDPSLNGRPLPVFSLVTDADYFWDADTGIYVQNFKPDWEWPVNVEFFENDGNNEAVFNERAGVKINGQNSWMLPQKMLGIYFRGAYGSGSLDYPLFHDRNRTKFDNFVLRASGSDWAYTLMRDGLGQHLPQENVSVDHQGFRPSIVFINGEYMGIHNIRSRVDEEFVEENHDVEANTYDLITDDGNVEEGTDSAYWVMDGLFNEDLSIQANFDAVAAEVNMQDFADYWATEIWVSNSSWGHNVVLWKPQLGGKWRFVFTDLDRGFSGSTNDDIDGFTVPQNNNYDYARAWIRHALENNDFADYFAQRFTDHLHTSFHPVRVTSVIDEWSNYIAPEVPYHVERWTGTTSSYGNGIATVEFWENEIEVLRTFASERSPFMLEDLASEFGLSPSVQLYTSNLPLEAGRVRLNDFLIPGSPWNGPYFENMPFELTAEAKPGHEFVGWSQVANIAWVAEGSAWKYNDSGNDLGTAWRLPDYDDTSWAAGNAELGYGDGDETTVVSYGGDPDNKFTTTYFRHSFDPGVSETTEVTAFFQLRRDDGAVVYLNGEEVFRSNMPDGDIAFDTFSVDFAGGAAESNWNEYTLPIAVVPGDNVLAVEIHQFSLNSSDISFDLMLSAYSPLEQIFSMQNPLPVMLTGSAGYVARYQPTGECLLPETIAEDLTLTLDCSPYLATGTSTVLPDVTLNIEPGVEIWFPTDARLIVHGQLVAEGTAEAPLAFRLNPDYSGPWGNIQFDEATAPSIIQHAVVEGASDGDHPVHDRAAVAAWFSDVTLDHVELLTNHSNPVYAEHSQIALTNCTLHSDITGDLINVRHGSGLIDGCTFIGNDQPDTDAIDYDVVDNGVVRNSIIHSFYGFNSDGIDLGEGSSNTLIESCLIHHCTDKGISIGQASTAIIQDMTIGHCTLGVAMKDQGGAEVDHSTFYANQYAISAYEKNPGMGGGDVVVTNSIFSNSSHSPVFVDSLSTALVAYAIYDSDTLAYEAILEANPLFVDPDGYDFTLQDGSPAAGAGLNGEDYGASTMWSDVPRDLSIVEFGYAGIADPNREWLVLRNDGDEPLDLLGYSLSDAVVWIQQFPLVLGPGEQVWVVRDATFFNNVPDEVVEWESGQLANEGERILLHNSAGMVVDFVQYEPTAPWPVPVAEQESLVRVSAGLDNHFASSWQLETLIQTPEVLEMGNALRVFPNPANTVVQLDGLESVNGAVHAELWSVSGQLIASLTWSDQEPYTWDVSGIAPGLYIIRSGEQRAGLVIQ